MAIQYPSWVYSERDPPVIVTGPAHLATLPPGYVTAPPTEAAAVLVPKALPSSAVPLPAAVKTVNTIRR